MALASLSKRSLNCSPETLIATSRFKRASRARYTCPIPPALMDARISYGPSLSPAESGMRRIELSLADHRADRECITSLLGSPIQGDVKRKILPPELEARTALAASSPPRPFVFFFFSCLTVLIHRGATL